MIKSQCKTNFLTLPNALPEKLPDVLSVEATKFLRTFFCTVFCLCCLCLLVVGCGSLRNKTYANRLGLYYSIDAGQSLYWQDSAGRIQKGVLARDADGVLYERNDTLVVAFPPSNQPVFTSLHGVVMPPAYLAHNDNTDNVVSPVIEGAWFRAHYSGLDVDLVTLPFRMRFPQQGIPATLEVTPNAGAYFGWRRDQIQHRYKYMSQHRETVITSSSMGFGILAGLKPTFITPFNTGGAVSVEYDAVGFFYGIGGIVGFDGVTFGLSAGLEFITDRNAEFFIYQQKPWLGIILGVNLN
jgi:hypothetical protein